MKLLLAAALLLSACASHGVKLREPSSAEKDVDCDGGLFAIERSYPTGGSVFHWIFRKSAAAHFEKEGALMGDSKDLVDLDAGDTYRGETPTHLFTDANVPIKGLKADLTFTKDQNSEGYFVRAMVNDKQISEFYFHHCDLGSFYR